MPRKIIVEVSPVTARLVANGWLHVTGLPTVGMHDEENVVQPHRREFGRWCQNNSRVVAVTTEGEVWLRDAGEGIDMALVHEICPNGEGAFVPCSNGETIEFRHVMGRVADPYESFEDSGENLSAIPKPRD